VLLYDYPLESSSRNGNGLKVLLKRNQDIWNDDICTAPAFLVHSPFELPGSYDQNERVDYYYGYDFEVLITPEIIRTDEGLRSYEPKARGCYFKGEKKLKYFKVYTKRNCEFECYGNYLFDILGCTPYYVVRNETSAICDHREEVDAKMQHYYALRNTKKCECLDECDSIKYNFEVFAHSNDDLTNASYSIYRHHVDTYASFDFKFKDTLIAPLRRYQPFTFTEFLAQSGGMMGLFAGISALSIIELLYFMSLRWMMNFWEWLGRDD
jgi:acid-sensing ion channel, other